MRISIDIRCTSYKLGNVSRNRKCYAIFSIVCLSLEQSSDCFLPIFAFKKFIKIASSLHSSMSIDAFQLTATVVSEMRLRVACINVGCSGSRLYYTS